MTEMIDRIAKAIHAKHMAPDDNQHWFHEDPSKCQLSRQLAIAALEAARVPTSRMCQRACNALKRHIDSFTDDERRTRWPGREDDNGWRVPNKEKHHVRYQAMIDAALGAPAPIPHDEKGTP